MVTTLILRLSVVCISLIIPRVAIFAPAARQDFCLLLSVLRFWYYKKNTNIQGVHCSLYTVIFQRILDNLPANRSDSKLASDDVGEGMQWIVKKKSWIPYISSLALCLTNVEIPSYWNLVKVPLFFLGYLVRKTFITGSLAELFNKKWRQKRMT